MDHTLKSIKFLEENLEEKLYYLRVNKEFNKIQDSIKEKN